MNNIKHLLESIRQDSTSAFKRWSMRELAAQKLQTNNNVDDETSNSCTGSDVSASTELLQSTVQRLELQHEGLRAWKEALKETMDKQQNLTATSLKMSPKNAQLQASILNRIETLQYIHFDTYRIGQQILNHPSQILVRQTTADRHVIQSTFLEIRARHSKTIETIVDIVSDIRSQQQQHGLLLPTNSADGCVNHELIAEQLLRRRIGIQLLCDHHVALHKKPYGNGGITVHAKLLEHVIADAIQEATHIVGAHLPIVPNIIAMIVVDDNDDSNKHDTGTTKTVTQNEITCTMVQPYIHYAIVELLKNAMKSSVANHPSTTTENPPLVYVKCYENEHGVITIDIIDSGTGMKRNVDYYDENDHDAIQRAFVLGHTTASTKRYDRLDEQQSYASVQIPPLASLGVGVPISKYLVEHFGGTLHLFNNDAMTTTHRTTGGTTTGCTARIKLLNDETILERYTPL